MVDEQLSDDFGISHDYEISEIFALYYLKPFINNTAAFEKKIKINSDWQTYRLQFSQRRQQILYRR